VELLEGVAFIRLGGIVSRGPPSGGIMFAHRMSEIAKKNSGIYLIQ
jgi:hypothetical protein